MLVFPTDEIDDMALAIMRSRCDRDRPPREAHCLGELVATGVQGVGAGGENRREPRLAEAGTIHS